MFHIVATACDANCNAGMCTATGYGKCDVGQCAGNYGRASDGSCVGKEQSRRRQQMGTIDFYDTIHIK